MKFKNELNDSLFEAILSLDSVEECYKFFIDLCTIKELEAMANRFEAAKRLNAGMKYNDILNSVNISSATLSRVSRALKYGEGGYLEIIKKTVDNKK